MTNKVPYYSESFECSVVNHTVEITGNDVELYGNAELLYSAPGQGSCSDSWVCGLSLGSGNCQYRAKRKEEIVNKHA
jgi:hypothetical protein